MLNITTISLTFSFLMLSSTPIMADPDKPMSKPGEQTRHWLELQKKGQVSSPNSQALPGPAAAQIYQRYLNSFSHPIPEYFSETESNPFNNSQ